MKHGDHVTVLANGQLCFGRHTRYGIRTIRRHGAQTIVCRQEDEGVTWVKGWRDETSEEGKAMLAAYVMAATASPVGFTAA